MIDVAEIAAVARCFAGQELSQTQDDTLRALCLAAQDYWQGQLNPELTQEDCRGPFLTACAWTALAAFSPALEQAEPTAAFTAGDLSVRPTEAARSACARSLQAQARALMVPYTTDDAFAFLEVTG